MPMICECVKPRVLEMNKTMVPMNRIRRRSQCAFSLCKYLLVLTGFETMSHISQLSIHSSPPVSRVGLSNVTQACHTNQPLDHQAKGKQVDRSGASAPVSRLVSSNVLNVLSLLILPIAFHPCRLTHHLILGPRHANHVRPLLSSKKSKLVSSLPNTPRREPKANLSPLQWRPRRTHCQSLKVVQAPQLFQRMRTSKILDSFGAMQPPRGI
jgi:hypothetical protein